MDRKLIVQAVLVLGGVLALGCTHQQPRAFDPSLCQEPISYQAGFNDGRKGYEMNSEYAYRCREDLRAGSLKGYQEGYEKGYAEYKKMVEDMRRDREAREAREAEQRRQGQQFPHDGPVISPNPKIVIYGGGSRPDHARRWYCKVRAFMTTFDAFGPTQLEAQHSAQRSCQGQYHEMHCRDVQCQQNI